MPDAGPPSPRWPARLATLVDAVRDDPEGAGRQTARGEAWLLLNAALLRYATGYGRGARLAAEDIEDLAAEKSLELLRRAETGAWRVEGRAAGEIAAYLASVARHGVVDRSRQAAHRLESVEDTTMDGRELQLHRSPSAPSPAARVEGRDFARALRQCAETLQPRTRRIWLFRVFYEMPTRDIAAHPEVALKPGHVDVLLQRCRESIRECMREKGFELHEIPPGTFIEMWKCFEWTRRTAEVDG